MPDSPYTPPSEETEFPLSDLEQELHRWELITLFAGLPLHLSPILIPIVAIVHLLTKQPPLSVIIIGSLLIIGFSICANLHLTRLKLEKSRREKISGLPPDLPAE